MKRKNRFSRRWLHAVVPTQIVCVAMIVLLSAAVAARADDDGVNPYQALEDRLSKALSGGTGNPVGVAAVEKTEADGLLEVTLTNGMMVYATESGGHFVVGDLYAIRGGGLVNLAEQKREIDRKAVMDNVELAQMIVFSPKGETRDYISVFTDVTCFYCQKLHREVEDLNDRGIEVRYLAYPRAGLDSDGAKKLATAWCADNQQDSLTQLKAGTVLPVDDCAEAPIAAQYQLGVDLGVRGTPAIITSGGQMIPGYRPAADIAQMLGLN